MMFVMAYIDLYIKVFIEWEPWARIMQCSSNYLRTTLIKFGNSKIDSK